MASASVGSDWKPAIMRSVLVGVFYNGEPVYKEWNAGGTEVSFFSRETKRCSGGGWKFVRWIPLHKIKVDRRYGHRRIMVKVLAAQEHLLTLKGITTS